MLISKTRNKNKSRPQVSIIAGYIIANKEIGWTFDKEILVMEITSLLPHLNESVAGQAAQVVLDRLGPRDNRGESSFTFNEYSKEYTLINKDFEGLLHRTEGSKDTKTSLNNCKEIVQAFYNESSNDTIVGNFNATAAPLSPDKPEIEPQVLVLDKIVNYAYEIVKIYDEIKKNTKDISDLSDRNIELHDSLNNITQSLSNFNIKCVND